MEALAARATIHGFEWDVEWVPGWVEELLKEELGDRRIRVAQCGPAGENLVRYACVINDINLIFENETDSCFSLPPPPRRIRAGVARPAGGAGQDLLLPLRKSPRLGARRRASTPGGARR